MSQHADEYGYLKLLYDISQTIYTSEDAREILRFSLEKICDYFDVQTATVSLFNPNNNRLEIEASKGMPEDLSSWCLPLGIGLTGWVALNHKPVSVADVSEDPRYVKIVDGLKSALAVPILDDSSSLGVISIESAQKGAFNDDDLVRLGEVAECVSKVIQKTWRFEHVNHRNQQLESVIGLVEKVSNRFELEGIFRDLTFETRKILDCEMCAVFLLSDPRTLELEVLVGRDGIEFHREVVELDYTSMGAVVNHQRTVEVSNLPATEEFHFVNLGKRKNLMGMLSTPLTYEGQVIGVLNAYTSKSHRFSDTEKQVFRALADIGALATENAKLYMRIIDSEESVRNSERLTTLGMLSSEIAHEIRNPLTVIQLLVESMGLDVPEGDAREKDLRVILDKIENLGAIVGRVLDFGKGQNQIFAKWDAGEIVKDSIRLVRFKLKRAKIEVEYVDHDPIFINCSKGQIQQVFLNLFINAEEAMAEAGKIKIWTELMEPEKRLCFYFSDTGSGIPENIRENVFDSFLTGKPTGTGLGLAIVKRILKDHRGNIEILSSSTQGTTFRFWVPVLDETF